ncbi:MAG TPA: hypothetical protein PKZ84_01140 [Anaerolineae bacterium]|nr:hypothetical protein [Anaerolineae bacterium]HQI83003.1 hypothetical protein [Anaerolineae bacterium]
MSSTVQNDQYWEQFSILPSDLEHLINFLVETERPHMIDQLAQELARARHQQMVSLIADTLSQGRIYRPGERYAVGEHIIFPHLNNLLGEVIAVRTGHNPEYSAFDVITVKMASGSVREFVTALNRDHPLNTATYLPSQNLNLEDIFDRYGNKIKSVLRSALEKNPQFISVGDQWFLRDLVMDVPPGQLNIAEALLDMAGGGPLSTASLLDEMEMPAELSRPLQLFSLEYALLHDRRFDEVGPAGYAMWHLRQMEPKGVLEVPLPLRYMPIPYSRALLDDTMLSLERQIDDEWADVVEVVPPVAGSVTVVLTYPHWRSGTLPLSQRVAQLFPTARITDRICFTFMDARTRETFPGWVVRSGRYVHGLTEWYKKNSVSVGAYVDLEHSGEPGTIQVSVRPIRSKRREWLRTVTTDGGQLQLEVTRVPVACEFDELATVAVADPNAVDSLAQQLQRASLESLLEQIFNGLAGLSLQRAVHAMTLYSVLNLLRRVPPAPMLAVLATSSRYMALGDNYWAYRGES